MLNVITTKAEAPAGETPAIGATLDDLARDGARRMIAAALTAKSYVEIDKAVYDPAKRQTSDDDGAALPRARPPLHVQRDQRGGVPARLWTHLPSLRRPRLIGMTLPLGSGSGSSSRSP